VYPGRNGPSLSITLQKSLKVPAERYLRPAHGDRSRPAFPLKSGVIPRGNHPARTRSESGSTLNGRPPRTPEYWTADVGSPPPSMSAPAPMRRTPAQRQNQRPASRHARASNRAGALSRGGGGQLLACGAAKRKALLRVHAHDRAVLEILLHVRAASPQCPPVGPGLWVPRPFGRLRSGRRRLTRWR